MEKYLETVKMLDLDAGQNSRGYGSFRFKGKTELAHRVSFFLTFNRWPTPCALHKCDNPLCVNPAHLFEGTIADNNKDKQIKGKARRLTEQDIILCNTLRHRCRVSATELAEIFKLSPSRICQITKLKNSSPVNRA